LKASFEAINHGLPTHEFSIGRELAGAAAVAAAAHAASGFASEGLDDGPPSKKRKSNKSSEPVLDVVSGGLLGDDSLMEPGMSSDLLSGDLRDQDWNLDPNEPRYCICHQVSYGDMVACDNEDVSVPLQFDKFFFIINGLPTFQCPYEWFHYPCVGIEVPPKGKWYCPTCQTNMARRKGRK
jgi:inhibitor of growth protein 3